MTSNIFSTSGNWIFIGFMFIGIAAGMYFNVTGLGTLAGMGVGFIARALLNINSNSEKPKKIIQL